MKVVSWKGFILLCSHNIEASAGKIGRLLLIWFEYVTINGMDKTGINLNVRVHPWHRGYELKFWKWKSNHYFGETR